MELGHGPLRTKQLTERVREFSSRSAYRCVGKMEAYGLIDRSEEGGVPSTVRLRLAEPLGRNLCRLLRPFASWDEMCLLGELWEAGFVEELSHGPRSLMDLMEAPHRLTYHQVKRRVNLAVERGLLEAFRRKGNGKAYDLTDWGRRYMSLIASIGRWRHRYAVADGTPGLTIDEMATVLRAVLPLTRLPEHAETGLDLIIAGSEDRYGHRDTAIVHGEVDPEGVLRPHRDAERPADGSAAATINTWFGALLDDHRGRIRVRGDLGLVDACLTQLYERLWEGVKGHPQAA